MGRNGQFDVFISHSSADKSWVTALANNLGRHGLRIWLDKWELVAGERFVRGLQEGLDRSKAGILVVTQEAHDSGWVQDEYEVMLRRRNKDPSFRLIPVLLNDAPELPFLGNIQGVSFRDPLLYRRALYELLAGLRGEPPGSTGAVEGELELPPLRRSRGLTDDARTFLDDLFRDLDQDQLQLVLAQDGMATGPVTDILLDRARGRFGRDNVLHLVPPVSGEGEDQAYFAELARQLELTDGGTPREMVRRHLESRARSGRICLVLTGFENGLDSARRSLASLLRSVHDTHREALRIIFRGVRSWPISNTNRPTSPSSAMPCSSFGRS